MTILEMESLPAHSEVIYLEDGMRLRCRVLSVEVKPNGDRPDDWLGIQLEVLEQEQSNGLYRDAKPGERFEAGLCISIGGAYCGWSLSKPDLPIQTLERQTQEMQDMPGEHIKVPRPGGAK